MTLIWGLDIPSNLASGQVARYIPSVSLLEPLEPLEGVVDEDPVLVGQAGLRVGGNGDLQVHVGELVEVRGVVDRLHPDHDGSRPLPGQGQD